MLHSPKFLAPSAGCLPTALAPLALTRELHLQPAPHQNTNPRLSSRGKKATATSLPNQELPAPSLQNRHSPLARQALSSSLASRFRTRRQKASSFVQLLTPAGSPDPLTQGRAKRSLFFDFHRKQTPVLPSSKSNKPPKIRKSPNQEPSFTSSRVSVVEVWAKHSPSSTQQVPIVQALQSPQSQQTPDHPLPWSQSATVRPCGTPAASAPHPRVKYQDADLLSDASSSSSNLEKNCCLDLGKDVIFSN